MVPNFTPARDLELLTAELPGVGGRCAGGKDFVVEEIPAYLPSGAGEHVYAWIEKRGLNTAQAIDRLARHLGCDKREVGSAGLKDRHAVTRQWLSLPRVDVERLAAYRDDELEVLSVGRHGNKLRTGHLRGNRFQVVLRGIDSATALERAQTIFARLTREGVPNYFGEQRFGREGDNALRAWEALTKGTRLPRDHRLRRLLISSLQSAIFNELLQRRLREGTLLQMLDGDVLQRRESGGLFVSEDREVDQARLEQGELVPTGPLCGPRMTRPREGSAARLLEDELLDGLGVPDPEVFSVFGRLARGGRRPLTILPADARVSLASEGDPALELHFSLPAGCYATVLLRELTKVLDTTTPTPLEEADSED